MSLLSVVPLEVEHELAELVAPAWVFPAIAAAVFIILAAVSWSYRDVFNRHRHKTTDASDGSAHSN